jgi:DNA polymerase II small subunit/DNA polymerase delta subunit B
LEEKIRMAINKQPSLSDIEVGDTVERVNSDYKFVGTVRSVFQKNSGLTRFVVEDDRGVLFIWNRKNFEKVSG